MILMLIFLEHKMLLDYIFVKYFFIRLGIQFKFLIRKIFPLTYFKAFFKSIPKIL